MIPEWASESEKYRKINEALTPRRKKQKIYSHVVNDAVEARIPPSIIATMSRVGWNVFGLYEVVQDEIRKEKRNRTKES